MSVVGSYSQCGEDRIIAFLLRSFGRDAAINYIDLGAGHPILDNNTFLFYAIRDVGVVVEADPVLGSMFGDLRPGDVLLSGACVPERLLGDGTIPFHIATDPGWSSILAQNMELAERFGKGGEKSRLEVPTFSVNRILKDHFPSGAIDVLSMDIEGVDAEILAELDFSTFRPKIIVAENDGGQRIHDARMTSVGYTSFAYTSINSVYYDGALKLGF